MNTNKSVFINGVIRFGLISAAVFALYCILIYVLEVNIFAPFFSIFSLLLTILFMVVPMVMGIRYINKMQVSPMGFGSKYLAALLIGFIGMLVYSILFWILMYQVDPAYMAGMQEQFISDMYDRFAEAGMSEDLVASQMERIIRQMERAKDPVRNLLTSLASSIITPGLIGLIVAAAVNTRRYHEDHIVVLDEETGK
ncbi:MAG TPA: DUF4199 domain-containing protein [Bacteroidales bacterium]|nr:DUF4199 domain-containing protein [Bacteroidales bacterium]